MRLHGRFRDAELVGDLFVEQALRQHHQYAHLLRRQRRHPSHQLGGFGVGAGADSESAELMGRMATLTPQQVRVLMMLSEGLLNKQIAYQLGVSEATVKAHVSAILQKLGVESRTQAVIAAAKIETGQWSQGAPAAG